MKKLILASSALAFATVAYAEDVKICVEGAYPPFSETSETGEVVGFDVDIANALCEEMGNSCEMVKVDWDGIIPALTEKKCDAIVASMTDTEERRQVIDFTAKYYNSPVKVVAPEGTMIADLDGKKIGVQRGTVSQEFVEEHYPDMEIVAYGALDEALLDLTSGRVDAVAADAIPADTGFLQTEEGEGYAFVEDQKDVPGDDIAIGVRQGEDEFRDALTNAIGAIRESGKYAEINDAYFSYDIYE